MKFRLSFTYIFLIVALIVAIIISVLAYYFFPFYEIKGSDKALDGVLLFSSISLGFYGACLSVLASIFNTKVIKEIMGDQEERREFLVVSGLTLLVGFLSVVLTIVYQVLIANDPTNILLLNLFNSIWFLIVILFMSMQILFVLIIFIILFNNKEDESIENKQKKVYVPKLK